MARLAHLTSMPASEIVDGKQKFVETLPKLKGGKGE